MKLRNYQRDSHSKGIRLDAHVVEIRELIKRMTESAPSIHRSTRSLESYPRSIIKSSSSSICARKVEWIPSLMGEMIDLSANWNGVDGFILYVVHSDNISSSSSSSPLPPP